MGAIQVGTYNILIPRHDAEGKGADSWLRRKDSVIETIDSVFDLVGLQECSFGEEYPQGEFVVEELHRRGWEGYVPLEQTQFSDRFHERLPIFWRNEVFELKSSGQLLLSSWSPQELALVPILENRYASYVRGTLRDGRALLFITLHLQHETAAASSLEHEMTQAKRLEAEQRLLAFLAREPADQSVVVAGDFNSAHAGATLMLAGVTSAESLARKLTRWEHNSFHDWEYPKNSEHFDKIFISEELSGGELAIGESLASDHYPVSYSI